MKQVTVVMPSFLASALINGDDSGFQDAGDVELYEIALKHCEGGSIVDVGDEYFSKSCDLPVRFAGNVAEYTVLYPNGED